MCKAKSLVNSEEIKSNLKKKKPQLQHADIILT